MRILVTGHNGFLGPFATAALRARGWEVVTASRTGGDAQVDLAQRGIADALADALAPDFVLNLAACSRLADCERDPARAFATNATAPRLLAERFGDRLLHVSTDLVFDGRGAPYHELDAVGPLSTYGMSKARGEEHVRQHGGRVARLPLLFGPDTHGRGASAMVRAAVAAGRTVVLFTDEYRTPLHAADAANGLVELLPLRRGPGIVHLRGPERCSRWDLGLRLCTAHGLDATLLLPAECQDATRPRDVSLGGEWNPPRSLGAMLAEA